MRSTRRNKIKERFKRAIKVRKARIRSLVELIRRHRNHEVPYIKKSVVRKEYALFRLHGAIDSSTIFDVSGLSKKEEDKLSDKHIILDFEE